MGPAQIFDAVTALQAGDSIDLNGAASPLDFDRASGESPSDQVVVCLAAGGAQKRGFDVVESGLRYETKAKRLAGELACP